MVAMAWLDPQVCSQSNAEGWIIFRVVPMWVWTLEAWHGMHCFAQAPACFCNPLHTKIFRDELSRWAYRGMSITSNTWHLQPAGTMGQATPVDVSHKSVIPCICSKWNVFQLQIWACCMIGLYLWVLFLGHGRQFLTGYWLVWLLTVSQPPGCLSLVCALCRLWNQRYRWHCYRFDHGSET